MLLFENKLYHSPLSFLLPIPPSYIPLNPSPSPQVDGLSLFDYHCYVRVCEYAQIQINTTG